MPIRGEAIFQNELVAVCHLGSKPPEKSALPSGASQITKQKSV